MTSQPGKQTIHILPNISRSKRNQKMKFSQLIDMTWEIFFLKNHTPKRGGGTFHRLFSKKSKLSISLDQ